MATSTRTTNRPAKAATPTYKSKSDHARALFKEGKTVAEVTRIVDMGYAFAYGVAKRSGFAETAAARKSTRAVTVDKIAHTVTIQTMAGPVVVHTDGRVDLPKKPKVKATPAT